jgi:glycine/D-amino acid oxidase-like deaminating enzyme
VSQNEEIAVLGAGIIGLTTAYLLTQRGYTVNLYAELTPFEKLKGKPEITTTVAAGYWMPLKVGNKAQTVAFAVASWNHYDEIMKLQDQTGRKLGITKLPAYALNDDDETFHFKIPGVIEPKDCMVTFGDRIYYKSKTFPTFVIETALYCAYLNEELEKSGKYRFVNATLQSKEDVLNLKENHIFNCFGLGSKEIFGDEKLRGIKGHILKFKLSDHETVKDFLLVMKTIDGGLHLQVPQHQSGNFMLGVSFEEGKKDSNVEMLGINKVFEQARNFYLQVEAQKFQPRL